jgi:hypothetical protein
MRILGYLSPNIKYNNARFKNLSKLTAAYISNQQRLGYIEKSFTSIRAKDAFRKCVQIQ